MQTTAALPRNEQDSRAWRDSLGGKHDLVWAAASKLHLSSHQEVFIRLKTVHLCNPTT